MKNLGKITAKGQLFANKIQQNRYINAITNSLMSLLPIMVIGAFSTLLSSIQWEPYQNFIAPVRSYIMLPASFTTNAIAIYAVFLIAYRISESFKQEGILAGVVALLCFLILTPITVFEQDSVAISTLTFDWLGARGLFTAMIVGVLSSRLFVYFVNKKLVINMPAGVPPAVAKTFIGLIPSVLVCIIFVIIAAIFGATNYGNFHQLVHSVLQIPLQGLGGTIWAIIIALFAMQLLWIFGIHGAMVVLAIINPIMMALNLENLEAYQNGLPMPNVVTGAFWSIYANLAPMLGLIVVLLFFTKSKQLKIMGKLGAPAALFGIHEPLIFGLPIVLNPILAIPYILSPIVCVIIGYILTISNIVPIPIGMTIPFGTPVIIQGILNGSWTFGVMQVLLIPVSALIYYPFVRVIDKKNLELQMNENER